MNDQWLPLTEYSSKYKVSVSTLRRRIRSNEIQFKFDDGKYFLADLPLTSPSKNNRPSQVFKTEEKMSESVSRQNIKAAPVAQSSEIHRNETQSELVQSLLSEIKKAYSTVLHEKEEQILLLKEEVSDLKTLIKILESDNERLRHVGSIM